MRDRFEYFYSYIKFMFAYSRRPHQRCLRVAAGEAEPLSIVARSSPSCGRDHAGSRVGRKTWASRCRRGLKYPSFDTVFPLGNQLETVPQVGTICKKLPCRNRWPLSLSTNSKTQKKFTSVMPVIHVFNQNVSFRRHQRNRLHSPLPLCTDSHQCMGHLRSGHRRIDHQRSDQHR